MCKTSAIRYPDNKCFILNTLCTILIQEDSIMSKDRLGLRLYSHKNSPSWLKKLIYFRWAFNNWQLEKQERKNSNNNIFEVSLNEKDRVYFELPVLKDLIASNIIISKQFFEHDYLLVISSLLNQPKCIIDVGANIGNHTLYFSKYWKEAKIYAFEPVSFIFNLLQRNIQLNNLSNTHCFNAAVGDREGVGRVAYNGQSEHNLGATRVDYCDTGEIPFLTLDEFILEHNVQTIDLIKIDVEGFELKVLNGMKQLINQYNPYIWVEVLDDNKSKAMALFEELDLTFMSAPHFNQQHDYLLRRKTNIA